MVAYAHPTTFGATVQAPPVVKELKAIFEALPDDDLLRYFGKRKRTGRPPYSVKVLWRSTLVRYALGLPSVSSLIRLLQDNPWVAKVCGINSHDEIPSQPTFSRFIARISKRPNDNYVKDLSREMVMQCYERLPDFGKAVAIDSTDVKAWANKSKRPPTDPDATWAVKSSVGNLRKFWLGYKAHLMVDVNYELPIALRVTKANVHDISGGRRVLREARRAVGGKFRPAYVTADAGYSAKALRRHISHQYLAEPIIKAHKTHKKWLPLETPEWKLKYHTRVSVERVFSRLKEHRALNHVTVRRIQKVRVHCYLSMIVLQAQALATGSRVSVRSVLKAA